MNRFRELVYALAFWAIRASVLAVVAFASSVACWLRSIASSSARKRGDGASLGGRAGRDDLPHHLRELLARCPNPAGGSSRPRRAAEIRDVSGNVDAGICATALAIARSMARPPASKSFLFTSREDLVVIPADVLRLSRFSNVAGVAPELAVRERSLLERSQRLHSLVRLAEQAQPEHSQDDDEQGGAHECHEQLDVDPGGQSPNGSDERVVGRAQQPALRSAGCCALLRHVRLRQVLRSSARPCCRRSS